MKSTERKFWIAAVGVSLFFNALFFSSSSLTSGSSESEYQHIFSLVQYYVERMYVEETDSTDLLIGAVRGMLAATGDPYTRFLDTEQHKEFSSVESGRKAGIGVEVTLENGLPLVIAPVEGGPAHQAGILPGDFILSIDGKKLQGLSLGEMTDLIGGEPGTAVSIELIHQGSPVPETVSVVRAFFELDYCRGEILKGTNTGYIRLTHFFGEDSGSVDEFRRYLEEFRDKRTDGVIIDLRSNAGGHLSMAGTLAGYFLKKDTLIVSAKGRGGKTENVIRAAGKTQIIPSSMPVYVLINKGSASASEVFSGALQDHKRAVLVGTRSFGKGSVQRIVRPMPDDTALLVTIQKYYTPSGRSIHNKGLDPDIEVRDITPGEDDKYFLYKMNKSGFFADFKKRNPVYSSEVYKKFMRETSLKGWKFSPDFSLFILKRKYGAIAGIDLSTDPQLRRAVEEIRKL